MKLLLRSVLLVLFILFYTFSPAHSQGWSLFGSKKSVASAATRYSIVQEYKEAYRPRAMSNGWFSFGSKKSSGRHYSRTHHTARHW